MRTILFLFLLCTVSFAQIEIVGDTTDLKLNNGSGIVLLEQFGKGNTGGGGLFHRIDSTYAEGTHAFNHPVLGYQWARINLLDQYITFGTSNNEILTWSTNKYNVFTPAYIDSFYTTEVVDTIAISGIAQGDKFAFTEYTPTWSATPDTISFSYYTKTDTCFVTRLPITTDSGIKSGALYTYIRLK